MPCPYCGAALADDARLCRACGRLIGRGQTTARPTAPASPPRNSPYGTVGPVQDQPALWAAPPPGVDPYHPDFDPSGLSPEIAAAWRQHRFQATFSVLLLLLAHFLTFGMASPFLLARKYAFLPPVKRGDFGTAKAAGFLFIPFFGLYWAFVLCWRLVDRLTLQAKLWNLSDAPSKGLSTAVAVGWVLGAIPYIGLLFWFPLHVAFWPIHLAQVQRLCNRLALEAAAPELRPAMLALERATRMRWIGWMVLVPCLVLVVTSTVVALVVAPERYGELAAGTVFFLIVAGGGLALRYVGDRDVAEHQSTLEDRAPTILAAYLRIDKNAAWTMCWLGALIATAFVVAGVVTLNNPTPATPRQDAWPAIVLGLTIGLGAGYAVLRALHLKREMYRLSQLRPSLPGAEHAPQGGNLDPTARLS